MINFFARICVSFSKLTPLSIRHKFDELIKHSGKNHNAQVMLGFGVLLFVFSLLIAFLFFHYHAYTEHYVPIDKIEDFDPAYGKIVDGRMTSGVVDGLSIVQQKLLSLGLGIIVGLLCFFSIYGYYYYIGEHRSSFVENVLPDALSLIASNISSGLTPYHAVKSATRPEFGPLAHAFEMATNKSLGNKAFHQSILEISGEFRSDSLRRSMKLFASSIESGSNMSLLLKNLAQDIRERHALRNELVTSTKTNSMFIMFMIVVGAPILLSISIFFVDIVSDIMGQNQLADGASLGVSMGGQIAITVEFLQTYSIVLLFLTGLIVSYFMGVIVEGDGRTGLKKAPLIIGCSYVVFFISLYLVRTFLGGMF